jgi:hypothetical protein
MIKDILFDSVKADDYITVKKILEDGCDLNLMANASHLHVAKSMKMKKLLLDYGAKINIALLSSAMMYDKLDEYKLYSTYTNNLNHEYIKQILETDLMNEVCKKIIKWLITSQRISLTNFDLKKCPPYALKLIQKWLDEYNIDLNVYSIRKKQCLNKNCVKMKHEVYDFCCDHVCICANCNNMKTSKSKFCRKHSCMVKNCINKKMNNDCCSDHICKYNLCSGNIWIENTFYCIKHKCRLYSCGSVTVDSQLHCLVHTCKISNCFNPTSTFDVDFRYYGDTKCCGDHQRINVLIKKNGKRHTMDIYNVLWFYKWLLFGHKPTDIFKPILDFIYG